MLWKFRRILSVTIALSSLPLSAAEAELELDTTASETDDVGKENADIRVGEGKVDLGQMLRSLPLDSAQAWASFWSKDTAYRFSTARPAP